jgi:hypothetical protein
MTLRLFAFALASAAALLSFEFFHSLLLMSLHINMQRVLLHVVLSGVTGAVLARFLILWSARRKRLSVILEAGKRPGNSI